MANHPEQPTTVWIACRAAPRGRCEGNHAVLLKTVRTPGGGSITHYKCSTCGRRFGVQV